MKRVKLLNIGGTITSLASTDTGYLYSGSLSGKELMKQIDICADDIELDIEDYLSIPSPEIKINNVYEIAKKIYHISEKNIYDGIVVTHGTDTMEETSYLLDLLLDISIPVVITGSQRSIKNLGFDGGQNIKDSILVASNNKSKNKGVLVVFNQEIMLAKYAYKANSTGVGGFKSRGTGPIGVTYGNKVIFYYDAEFKNKLEIIDKDNYYKKVHLIKMNLDFDTDLIDIITKNGCDGIVIEGFGIGAVTPKTQDCLSRAIERNIPVVLVTKCDYGGVRGVYGSKGGGIQLQKMGIIFEEILSGEKARIKLIAILNNYNIENIHSIWDKY